MVVVTGIDARAVSRVSEKLTKCGLDVHPVSGDDVIAERSFLFMLAMQSKPQGIVVWDVGTPTLMADRLLTHATAAASAAGAAPLVLVTTRSDEDPVIRRLRSDGVGYAVLRVPARLYDIIGLGSHLRGQTVLVPRDLATDLARALPFCRCLDAVVAALAPGAPTGRIESLDETGLEVLASVFEAYECSVEEVTALRARMAAWLGRPLLRARPDGDLEILAAQRSGSQAA